MGDINREDTDGVRRLTISAPDRMNAWTRAMRDALQQQLVDAAEDADVGAVVITGEGDAFCAGQDFNEVATWDAETPWIAEIADLYRSVLTFPKPTVAAVNGVAAGSGMQFALLCDYRVGALDARMGQTEVRWGLASITGTWLLGELLGPVRARALALSARIVEGPDLLRLGLVDEQVSADEVLERASVVAREMASYPASAFATTKAWCQRDVLVRLERAFTDAHEVHGAVFREGVSQAGAQRFLDRGED